MTALKMVVETTPPSGHNKGLLDRSKGFLQAHVSGPPAFGRWFNSCSGYYFLLFLVRFRAKCHCRRKITLEPFAKFGFGLRKRLFRGFTPTCVSPIREKLGTLIVLGIVTSASGHSPLECGSFLLDLPTIATSRLLQRRGTSFLASILNLSTLLLVRT